MSILLKIQNLASHRLSEQLLRVAEARINDTVLRSEANLRRAVSDMYYAMFHAVAEAFVEPGIVFVENGLTVQTVD